MKNYCIDDYYSYKNGKVVYASFQSDPRWGNRDYSVLQVLDIHTKKQYRLTSRSKYFSPDINADGTEVLAVNVAINGTNNLHRLDAATGKLVAAIPNPGNYFFTQTKYINNSSAVSAVRHPDGRMALVKVDLTNGHTENITPFSYNVLGYPSVKGDTVYFTMMNNGADNTFAVTLANNKIFALTTGAGSVYYPAVNSNNELVASAFTAAGNRLTKINLKGMAWSPVAETAVTTVAEAGADDALKNRPGAGVLYNLADKKNPVTPYRKGGHLFSFHSWRPVLDEPEYGYTLYSDNVLSNFTNSISYTYNRNDKSHTVGIGSVYAAWLPELSLTAEETFNRHADTAIGKPPIEFNTAKLAAGINIPLRFVGGRTSKLLNFGGSYNIEQYAYKKVTREYFQ
ncbi:TolB-like translocation protein [Ferruginibacter sp.]